VKTFWRVLIVESNWIERVCVVVLALCALGAVTTGLAFPWVFER
jgi:hypothetical protein